MTYTVLLAENALYGLVGSVIGVLLDSAVRPNLVTGVFAPAASDGTIVQLDTWSSSPALMLAVICGAMLIECICPIKEILLAVKTPIRDIIFSNKDTQYRYSRASPVTGIALAVIAAALLLSLHFRRITAALMLTLPETDTAGAVITLGLILWAVFTAVAVFPISRMNRMNPAEQLKYE